MLSIKGVIITVLFWIVLSNVSAQGPPFVLNANNVPAGGGLLQIYGLNFGKDASEIQVEIVDTAHQNSIKCVNVSIVIPNSIIACYIVDIGTGSSKHIAVTVNGISNEKFDTNTLFSRQAPKLESVSYDPDSSVVFLLGLNFGNDASRVNVSLDGIIYPVTAVNNSAITCQLPELYFLSNVTTALVLVDGQSNVEDIPVVLYSIPSQYDEVDNVDGNTKNSKSNWMSSDNVIMVAVIVSVVVGLILVSVVIGFVSKKRKAVSFGSANGSSGTTGGKSVSLEDLKRDIVEVVIASEQPDPANPVARATSMIDIDLDEVEAIYERNSPVLSSSSSSSSSLSPFSSSSSSSPANSPFGTPPGERKENLGIVVKSEDEYNDNESDTTTEYDSPSPSLSPEPSLASFTKTRRDLPQISKELSDVTSDTSADTSVAADADANAVKTEAAAYIAAALVLKADANSSPVIPTFPKVRRVMPPSLSLDPRDPRKKKSKFSLPMTPPRTTVQGMIRVPSSRLANRVMNTNCAKQGVFDSPNYQNSPELGIKQVMFDSPNL